MVQIAIDQSRNILYTLSEKSDIAVYHLGSSGNEFNRISRLSGIRDLANRILETQSYGNYIQQDPFKIESIHIVSESRELYLVGITNTGARLYFSCVAQKIYNIDVIDMSSVVELPTTLRLVFVRPAPSFNNDRANHSEQIHVSFYSSGITIGANPVSEDVDCIVGMAPDFGVIGLMATWSEMFSSIYLEGKVYGIYEVGNGYKFNELESQSLNVSRKFLVFTNSGVTVLSKTRSIDILEKQIVDSSGQLTPALNVLFENFGVDQSCAMCLSIACQV